MKNAGRILALWMLMLPFGTFASSMSIEKQEGIAMFAYLTLMGIAIVLGYILYKRKYFHHSMARGRERFRYKTFELMDHGKKIIMVKRYRVSQ